MHSPLGLYHRMQVVPANTVLPLGPHPQCRLQNLLLHPVFNYSPPQRRSLVTPVVSTHRVTSLLTPRPLQGRHFSICSGSWKLGPPQVGHQAPPVPP